MSGLATLPSGGRSVLATLPTEDRRGSGLVTLPREQRCEAFSPTIRLG